MTRYYQPELEDLFIGYECERLGGEFAVEIIDFSNDTPPKRVYHSPRKWENHIIEGVSDFTYLPDLRTPYLTPSDIIKCGWKCREDLTLRYQYRMAFEKGNYFLVFDEEDMHIEIIAKDVTELKFMKRFPENFRITIPCPSINEFRKILKLLKIK